MVVTPESVVTIVHAAGKKTSTPGTSPGSKKQESSSGCCTIAAPEAGAVLKTHAAATVARPIADSASLRILMMTPKEIVSASYTPPARRFVKTLALFMQLRCCLVSAAVRRLRLVWADVDLDRGVLGVRQAL